MRLLASLLVAIFVFSNGNNTSTFAQDLQPEGTIDMAMMTVLDEADDHPPIIIPTLPESLLDTCRIMDFQQKPAEMRRVNEIIDFLKNGGILKMYTDKYDPLVLTNAVLRAIPLQVLGTDFELVPTISKLKVVGIKSLELQHVNVKNCTALSFGANLTTGLTINATVNLSVRQTKRAWYLPCWTDLFNPNDCKPLTVDLDVSLGLTKPSLVADSQFVMLECAQGATGCKDLSFDSILGSLLLGEYSKVSASILRRMQDLFVTKTMVAFDQLTAFHVHFHQSGPQVTEMGKQFWAYFLKIMNKKGEEYKAVMYVLEALLKKYLNKLVGDHLAGSFGANCVEA